MMPHGVPSRGLLWGPALPPFFKAPLLMTRFLFQSPCYPACRHILCHLMSPRPQVEPLPVGGACVCAVCCWFGLVAFVTNAVRGHCSSDL